MTTNSEHFQGACHCGTVRFSAELDLASLASCNCSMCGRTGAIMAFISANQLQKLSGEDKLTDYQFGKKVIHHSFCSICGVRPYAMGRAPDGSDAAMVNVRCLDGIDVHSLKVSKQYDGKSL